jgi:Tfp pilus assembly protein PilN
VRPVNLIPPEQRSGGRKPMKGGPIAYIVVGAMVAALLGVTLLVVTDNQISESKAEITQLQREQAAVEARANELAAYTQFHSVREQRVATVVSLADSRFDWDRVLRELALVLPGNVSLDALTGTAKPGVTPEGATSLPLRASISGPALEMTGCASSQDAVAGLIQALEDIDGVTRVGVESSTAGSDSESVESGSAETSASCQSGSSGAHFQIVAAFDAAPVPSEAAATTEAAPAPEAEATTTTTPSAEG